MSRGRTIPRAAAESDGTADTTAKENRIGYVYFLRGCITRNIKIGFSDDPVKRYGQLGSNVSESVEPIGYFPGSRETERWLQDMFSEYCDHNEWFKPGVGLLAFIEHAPLLLGESAELPRRKPGRPPGAKNKKG